MLDPIEIIKAANYRMNLSGSWHRWSEDPRHAPVIYSLMAALCDALNEELKERQRVCQYCNGDCRRPM